MKVREKHEELRGLIVELASSKSRFWKAVAKCLNRPRRMGFKVNVWKIDKFSKKNEKIVVPGVVLGAGSIGKPVTVAALKFSKSAKEKIAGAGGKAITIKEMLKAEKDGKGLRLMG